MDILDLVKDSTLFDDRLIAVTGPILVAMVLGSWHEMKRLFHPVIYILRAIFLPVLLISRQRKK
jgi:hypothetical protein